jgi:hypothetical protein
VTDKCLQIIGFILSQCVENGLFFGHIFLSLQKRQKYDKNSFPEINTAKLYKAQIFICIQILSPLTGVKASGFKFSSAQA